MDSPGKRWEKFRATAEQAQQEGMYEFAETAWTAALEQAEDFGDTDRRLAYTLEKLAECLWHQGKLTDAANHCKRVLKMYEKVLGAQHPDVACFMGNLAMIYHARKMYEDAEIYYKKALEIKAQILGQSHPDVKKLEGNFADLLFVTNREEEAAKLKAGASVVTASDWRKTTQTGTPIQPAEYNADTTKPADHYLAALGGKEATTLPPVADISAKTKTTPTKETGLSERTLSTLQKSSSAGASKPRPVPHSGNFPIPPALPTVPIDKARARAQEQPMSKEESFEKWKQAKEEAEKNANEGNLAAAEEHWMVALKVAERIGEENPPLSYTLYSLGDLKARQEVYDGAIIYHQRAYDIKKKVLGAQHMAVAASANALARLFYYARDYNQAEKLAIECITINERNLGPEHQDVANAIHNLATLYHVQRKYAEAEPSYKRALEIKQKVFGSEHPDTLRLLRSYADLLRSTGREIEAQALDATSTGMITGSWKTIDLIGELGTLQAHQDRCDICNAQLGGAPKCPSCGFEAAIGVI